MDGQRFDHLTRAMAAGVGRRSVVRTIAAGAASALLAGLGLRRGLAQQGCESGCPDGLTCVDGGCVQGCQSNRDCRDGSGDACVSGRCENGICVQLVVDCAPGYVCCNNGECCPIPCTTDVDCITGDLCAIARCGSEGVCEYTRRDPCVTCRDDAGCAELAPGSVCCDGTCFAPCPEGFVLSKGCECRGPSVSGSADGVVVVVNDPGASNVRVTPEPAPTTEPVVEAPPSVETPAS